MKKPTRKTEDRRRHDRRLQPQLYLRIAGAVYRTVEWSYGGLVIEDYDGHLPTGALLQIDGLADEETYRDAHPPYQVDIRARVVRVMPERQHAVLSCLKIDDAAYRILSGIENETPAVMAGRA
jgi:hypothetical protein